MNVKKRIVLHWENRSRARVERDITSKNKWRVIGEMQVSDMKKDENERKEDKQNLKWVEKRVE